uniref:Phosphoinositide phospholipase C n=1 Tax=Sinocyclocheilus rhinocerous TaxID=307959 RepID=A0A673HW22_9TELE
MFYTFFHLKENPVHSQEADTDENQGSLTFEEFCTFYKLISTRRDLYLLMITYSNHKEHMDLNDLQRFLENEQKMVNVTKDYCKMIINQFEPCSENQTRMVLGIDGFTNYMRSPAGDVFNPEHYQVNQDMTQPLTNYYIASSHNTYLTGDQLLSQSRVDMYAYVLQAGCRCVEVDCWDGPDGEPIVHHGYTLTSKILFKDVVETINKYAFAKTQYPVILSIENHCTVPQQKKMAQHLMEVLQDKLDLSNINVNESRRLPSPELLKGKVLVKGKKLPANIDADAEEGDVSDEDSGDEDEEEEEQINGDVRFCVLCKFLCRRRKTMRLSRALSDLVKYTKSVRVHDIETQAYMCSWQVSSLNESLTKQILQLKPAQLVRLNQRQLLRVYPSNYRVDSSNFNPQPFWNARCHLVALNYQTEGRMLQLNRAKFAANGNCGYVLKPKCLCKGAFNPMLEDPLPGHRKSQLVLKIISGQQLPKPKDSMLGDRGEIIDPFVEVEIIGLPIDCNKQQTRVVDDNGFNPMWEETLVFTLHMPQIALVRFMVWDHDPIGRDFIGQRTIAFKSMMPGYRHVYLEGMEEASIFVHVAINDITGKVTFYYISFLFCINVATEILTVMAQGHPLARTSCGKELERTKQKRVNDPDTPSSKDSPFKGHRSQSVPRRRPPSPPNTPHHVRKDFLNQHPLPQCSYSAPKNSLYNNHNLAESESSSLSSLDSLDLSTLPSRFPGNQQQTMGTLQREMNALFEQKMREIRCHSPLFLRVRVFFLI